MSRFRALLRAPSGRLRTPWRLLLAAVFFLLVNLGVAVAFAAAGIDIGESGSGSTSAGLLSALILTGIALSVAALVAARYLDHRTFGDLGLNVDDRWWRDLAAGATLGVALVGSVSLLGSAVDIYTIRFDPTSPSGYPLVAWFVLLAATMVAVGVYEELLLRGYVLGNLAEGFTAFLGPRAATVGALVVSSVTFGFLHGMNPSATPVSLLTITLAGVMLGVGYVCTDRLALPIGLHITWNLTHALFGHPVSGLGFGIRLFRTEPSAPELLSGGAFGPEGGLFGLAATLVGCLAIVAYARLSGRGFEANIAEPRLRE